MTKRKILPGSLVSTEWLAAHIDDPGLRIVDIRGYVKSEPDGDDGHQVATYVGAPEEYEDGHIPGAVFVDWTSDITDPDNPVPAQIAPPERFKKAMEAIGIGDDTNVVVVDHAGGHFATRLWWALKYYGHDQSAILDGGYAAWAAENRPLSTSAAEPRQATFTPRARPELIADANDVLEAIGEPGTQIIDARDARTFSGEVYRGSRRGHIPSAVSVPIAQFLDEDGRWRSPQQLDVIFEQAGVGREEQVIGYCNGGVTATAVLFALDRAGRGSHANYDGSWNEWAERPELPVEKGTNSDR